MFIYKGNSLKYSWLDCTFLRRIDLSSQKRIHVCRYAMLLLVPLHAQTMKKKENKKNK